MIRILLSFIGASIFTAGIFWTLQIMIKIDSSKNIDEKRTKHIDVVRLKRKQDIIKKERVKPKKPKPLKKPKPKIALKTKKIPIKQKMTKIKPLDFKLPIKLSASSMLGDAVVSKFAVQEIDTDVIPLSRVKPVYPRRAKRLRIEGEVKAEFTITLTGGVKDILIVKSEPKGVFDRAAKRSLIRWKFKPKMQDGEAVEQRALLKFTFKLEE